MGGALARDQFLCRMFVVFGGCLRRSSGQGADALCTIAPVAAANPPTPSAKLDSGDNAWMLTSSALVLMMTGPGLALFYCGLVRKKNVLSVMMQCIFLMCLMTVIWGLYGFSLSFGGSGAWIGDTSYMFMNGVGPVQENGQWVMKLWPQTNVPVATFMLFQCMFFIITPALICGAFAERMKFSTMVVFMILWATLIYCPLAIGSGGTAC